MCPAVVINCFLSPLHYLTLSSHFLKQLCLIFKGLSGCSHVPNFFHFTFCLSHESRNPFSATILVMNYHKGENAKEQQPLNTARLNKQICSMFLFYYLVTIDNDIQLISKASGWSFLWEKSCNSRVKIEVFVLTSQLLGACFEVFTPTNSMIRGGNPKRCSL